MPWKNTSASDHTAAVPPSRGKAILANIGWIRNISSALENKVAPNTAMATCGRTKDSSFLLATSTEDIGHPDGKRNAQQPLLCAITA